MLVQSQRSKRTANLDFLKRIQNWRCFYDFTVDLENLNYFSSVFILSVNRVFQTEVNFKNSIKYKWSHKNHAFIVQTLSWERKKLEACGQVREISDISFWLSLFLILNIFHTFFKCFHCWLCTGKTFAGWYSGLAFWKTVQLK